eukprot:scaffold93362_cov48-Prasinocladus_malaysianus.AAC.3
MTLNTPSLKQHDASQQVILQLNISRHKVWIQFGNVCVLSDDKAETAHLHTPYSITQYVKWNAYGQSCGTGTSTRTSCAPSANKSSNNTVGTRARTEHRGTGTWKTYRYAVKNIPVRVH